ncbi:peptidylprolyl isomerase [Roseisolibacter sp. H3M3-2]|uniref:peptidylprolyl isomerase n=1 Tax=Roseisolibacter sp. H3M3-2 TaxID=3031323 RepID=UPI0023DB122A|nr:peptidylprolyl isomerase [Roseisolibacter sp. H3M3-2]MDF1503427.1 peptidylprolyl isomerase [Roseisolibacter sp. H3M3-2]
MIRQRLLVLATTGALATVAACDGFKEAMTAHVDTVAKAGSQELSVERLGQLMGRAPMIPLQREVAKNLASLWVDYQLLAAAAAAGDSLADQKTIDDAVWAVVAQERIRKLGEQVLTNVQQDTSNAAARYAKGELLSARHILVGFGNQPPQPGQQVPQAVKDSARRKAEGIRAQATPANFADLARRNSTDAGSAANGGSLGIFPKGAMVPQFEQALAALQPGQMTGLVESPYGYHIIYRPTFAEVAPQFTQALGQRTRQVAESTYLANLETAAKVEIKADAPLWTKAIAQDVDGHREDDKVLATSSAGDLTAGRVAQWISALPMGPQLKAQIQQAPDSVIKTFVKQLARNEVLLKQADSAKITLDTAETGNLRRSFVGAVTGMWNGLGINPVALNDSAKTKADKERLAASRVENYLDRLTRQQAQFVEVPPPIEAALRGKFEYALNDKGIDRALERAAQVRASADSARIAGQPGTAVPLPGAPGAAPGGAPGATPAPPAPAPQGKQP